ncbi:hypothetical protein CH063_00241 [Colletotrichum higginsianum]|uniref:DUF7371 domain-containing protein n=1 Tax=Colletotrichum higginsianum (strain IMI 349063) TaxID=759273 RepID=H1V9Q8_COLHI|nr:hypothetical protein CH63R_11948 [Colletotrichum higginsianum IMI 349063]OBR05245.1 hypothetical protein CH63R_11948 [Colletotrichum higginsianum IMI 349063]CCF36961.1 hypothetical protein CH063_00241 [Colletotrichum higginsianum]
MAALVAGGFAQPTCPAAATTTVFVTVGSANNVDPPVVVKTVTATVLPPAQSPWSPASPALPATLTVTIDSYDPPAGGSQFTGPKPWESSPAQPTALTVVTVTVPSPGLSTPVGDSPAPSGNGVTGGQQTPTGALSGPPAFPWNPAKTGTSNCQSATPNSGSGSNTAGVTVITTTLFRTNAYPGQATPSVDSVVASFTITFPKSAATGSVPGSAWTAGAVDPGSGELFTYTITAPVATGSPSGPSNGDSVTSFTTTLYRTRAGSGQGTPVVDALVTCFTVTFPAPTGTGPIATGVPAASTVVPGGVPGGVVSGGSVGTTTRYIATMVPGPDGSLSYSIRTVVSTFTVPTAGSSPTAGSVVTTTIVRASPSNIPSDGVATVVATTLYGSSPSAGSGNQPMDPSDPSVVVFTLTVPRPSDGGPATYITVLPSVPGDIGSGDASTLAASTVTLIQTVPASGLPPLAPGGQIPTSISGSYGDPALPGASGFPASGIPGSGVPGSGVPGSGVPGSGGPGSGSPGSGVPGSGSPGSGVPASGIPGSGPGVPITITVPSGGTDPTTASGLPGGYGDSAQTGVPPFVSGPAVIVWTVTQATPVAGVPTSIAGIPTSLVGFPTSVVVLPTSLVGFPTSIAGLPTPLIGGYGSVVSPATLASSPQSTPSVVTLWPVASSIDSALPNAATKTSCSTTLTTEIVSTAVLTSTLVNVVADATTTYTFPYESLVTTVGVSTIVAATGAAGTVTVSIPTASAAVSGSVVTSSAVAVSTWQSVIVQSSVVQVFTTGVFTSVIQSGVVHKRYVNTTATAVTPVPTPICTGTTEVGNLNLDFDDVPSGPFFNPYHRFWFSKGFLVGPPPLMPFLPSSGGRLIEFVPPVLSNSSADNASGDTAQIGMGKLASSPCFQFDFFGMNLGCHADAAVPNQLCVFTFTGYRWDAGSAEEIAAVSQDAWVNACNKTADCPLTPFSAVDFTGLSSILVTLRVDGQSQVWWGDDLRVGWSKNDCATASCRQQSEPEVSQRQRGPTWYWTPSGLRVLSSSRINAHFLM